MASTERTQGRYRAVSPADLVAASLLLLCLVLSRWCDFELDFTPLNSLRLAVFLYQSTLITVVIFVALALARRMLGRPSPSSTQPLSLRVALRELCAPFNLGRSAFELVKVVAVIQITLILWTNLQVAIPAVNSTLYDDVFVRLDTLLFFGSDPVYEMSHSSRWSAPWLARFFDLAYVLWYPIKLPVLTYLFLTPSLAQARRFSFAFALMWVGHIVLAMAWPSLGPCFVHPEWFSAERLPLAADLQADILSGYRAFLASPHHFSIKMYEGMAAFPSLHVGLVVLYSLALYERRRLLGGLMSLYAVIIFVGSGYTGWHYLVDGIVGAAMAVAAVALARRVPQWSGERVSG